MDQVSQQTIHFQNSTFPLISLFILHVYLSDLEVIHEHSELWLTVPFPCQSVSLDDTTIKRSDNCNEDDVDHYGCVGRLHASCRVEAGNGLVVSDSLGFIPT